MRLLAALLLAASAWAAPPPRFFVAGDGQLALVNTHTGARVAARYRRADGSYDAGTVERIRRVFGGEASLRLIEVLSHLQRLAGGRPLTLVSGYRSPEYNEQLREQGAKAAAGSLHTEGLAADVAFPRPLLRGLWRKVRALDCCGAGYYARQGFLHVDVGQPRFWEAATSRVDENLSAGNARLFARTEFDRFTRGEAITVTLHALTAPPVKIARVARFGGDEDARVTLEGSELREVDGCLEAARSGASVRVAGAPAARRGRLLLVICEPRPERTPATVETNPVEIR